MFKKMSRFLHFVILAIIFTHPALSYGQNEVVVSAKGQVASIENSFVKIEYNLARGNYKATDKRNSSVCITEAFTSIGVLNSSEPGFKHTWQSDTAKDALGTGKILRITSSNAGLPAIILEITLYAGKKFIVLAAGMDNKTDYPIQLKSIHPINAKAFAGLDLDADFRMLDGNGGGEYTRVTSENTLRCRNNLLVTFGKPGAKRSLVIGGLTYRDFEKFARASKNSKGAAAAGQDYLSIDLWGDDPVGKLVDPGSRYVPNDKYFVNFAEDNPFVALEEYGLALRAAQAIKLNVYDFPSVCLWYVSVEEYGGGPAINDSTGAVWEIEQAAQRGFLKYSPVAIRLVPDNLDGVRSMFTMAYVVSGRLLLGASFSKMTDDQLFILSRAFPYHSASKSARPVDAFSGGDLPQVYDFEVNPQWHQVTFFNTAYDSAEWKKAGDGSKLEPMGKPMAATVGVDLGKDTASGGLGLNPGKKYYAYDFWNEKFVGIYPGSARLEQQLRPGEARMMSVHEVENRPQFISTNRHVMQGYVDMPRCEWDGNKRELRGTSKAIGGETYKVIIALNGWNPKAANAAGAKSKIRVIDEKTGLAELALDRPQNGDSDWTITFDR